MRAKDYRDSAWQSLSGKWGVCVLAYLIFDLICGACAGTTFFVFGAIIAIIVIGPLTLGMSLISLEVARNKDVEVGMLFKGFNDFSRSLVLYITNNIFIALWSLLLIIPGIIKSLSYSMSYYILIDNPGMSANDARKKSMEMMNGNKWRLFCLEFSFIGWCLLSMLTFGILLFWIEPYMEVAKAKFYLSLLPEEEQKDSDLGNDGIVIDADLEQKISDDVDAFSIDNKSKDVDFKDEFNFFSGDDEFK